MTLFKEIAASLHHGLNARPEALAGLRHGGPREVRHHLRDLDHQRGGSAVRGSVGIPLTYAPDVIIQGIAVRAAGSPKVIKKEASRRTSRPTGRTTRGRATPWTTPSWLTSSSSSTRTLAGSVLMKLMARDSPAPLPSTSSSCQGPGRRAAGGQP